MIAGAAPERRHPQVLASIEVDRGQPRVRRLDDRQAVDAVHTGSRIEIGADVAHVALFRVHSHERKQRRRRSRGHVQDAALPIEPRAAPVGPARDAWHEQIALRGGERREQRTVFERR